jgi:mono/diheme cytochrome c family protein
MKTSVLAIALLCCSVSAPVGAQPQQSDNNLTPAQTLGKRVFQQRCGVCHTRVNLVVPMYGIPLNKELVDGNEDMIKDYIRNGSKRMPGFKYGLESSEIDAIVDYLKTVPKATAPQAAAPAKDAGAVE